jgi:hypothetical protein
MDWLRLTQLLAPRAVGVGLVLGFALVVATFASSAGSNLAQAAPAPRPTQALLELVISDAETQQLTPARVRLRDASGTDHLPADAVEVPIGPDRWFVSNGTVRLAVPAGRMNLRVERGPEYDPVCENIEIGSEPVVHHQVVLKRWINMRKLGYLCGEDHLHVPSGQLGAMLAAEGLDVGTSLSWWNGPEFKLPAGDQSPLQVSFGRRHFPATLFDAEVEDEWGAVYLIGLRQPLSMPADRRRSHLPFVRTAREQGALICYQGGWSREVLLDALLGYVDVVNVCNNNFHRHKYQPRRQYSNLLSIDGFPEYPDTSEGMMRMNTETYYRLLNCGLRLAAGAGSATGAKTTPAGYNRSYVRTGGTTNAIGFLEAWRAGRNFVTDGPMIFLTVSGSNSPGDVVALPKSGGPLRATARAICNQPLRSLEIVVNGVVAAHASERAQGKEWQVDLTTNAEHGSWIAARATAEDRLLSDEELARYVKSEGKPEKPCRLLFGHTSPVYVKVGGKGAAIPESLAEASRMLDAFERFALKTAAEPYRGEILDALRAARQKLRAQSN